MIHQRIMDVAAEQPDASLGEIADAVPGAQTGMVERVLDEYGDPADTDESESAESAHDSGESVPDLDALTEKQRETMYAIQASPEATQRELADTLDVSAATISQRVNGISGFQWSQRESFANAVIDAQDGADETSAMPNPDGEQRTEPDEQPDTRTIDGDDGGDDPTAGDETDGTSRVPSSKPTSATRPLTRRPIVTATTDVPRTTVSTDADSARKPDREPAQGNGGDRNETNPVNSDATMDGETDAAADTDTTSGTGTATVTGSSSDTQATSDGGAVTDDPDERFGHLHDRLTQIEERLDDLGDADRTNDAGESGRFEDPALAAKIVRACIEDDAIGGEEEVTIIESLLE